MDSLSELHVFWEMTRFIFRARFHRAAFEDHRIGCQQGHRCLCVTVNKGAVKFLQRVRHCASLRSLLTG